MTETTPRQPIAVIESAHGPCTFYTLGGLDDMIQDCVWMIGDSYDGNRAFFRALVDARMKIAAYDIERAHAFARLFRATGTEFADNGSGFAEFMIYTLGCDARNIWNAYAYAACMGML